MDIPTIARATSLFAHQQGLATVGQLRAVGVTEGFIRQHLRTREWRRIHRQVLGLSGTSPSWARDVRAALLAAGPHAVASHATAARLHGFDGYDTDVRIAISSTDGHFVRSTAGTTVHRSVVLEDRHGIVVDGFRCVIQPVALLQIAASDGADAVGKAFDSMLRAGRSTEWVRTAATEWRSRRMPGASIVFQLLRERVDAPLPGSWFQRLARTAFALRGIEPVDEHPVFDGARHPLARLDLAIPDLLVGVECQSWRWHATPTAQADDARRRRRLRALGWEIVEVWWTDLDRLDEVLEELVTLIDRRLEARWSRCIRRGRRIQHDRRRTAAKRGRISPWRATGNGGNRTPGVSWEHARRPSPQPTHPMRCVAPASRPWPPRSTNRSSGTYDGASTLPRPTTS